MSIDHGIRTARLSGRVEAKCRGCDFVTFQAGNSANELDSVYSRVHHHISDTGHEVVLTEQLEKLVVRIDSNDAPAELLDYRAVLRERRQKQLMILALVFMAGALVQYLVLHLLGYVRG